MVYQGRPDTLDPTRQASGIERFLCSLLYQTLFESNETGMVASTLLAQTSIEGQNLILDLNPQAAFHSGRRVGAEDVKYSLERAIARIDGVNQGVEVRLEGLVGLEDYINGKTQEVKGIQVVDENTISISWQGDLEELKCILSFPQFAILEKTTLLKMNNYGSSFQDQNEPSINGTGSYRMVDWDDAGLVIEPLFAGNTSRIEFSVFSDMETILYEQRMGKYDIAVLENSPEGIQDMFPAESSGWEPLAYGEVLYLKTGVPANSSFNQVLTLSLNRQKLREELDWERKLVRFSETGVSIEPDDTYYENPIIGTSAWVRIAKNREDLRIGYCPATNLEPAALAVAACYEDLNIPVRIQSYESYGLMNNALALGEIDAYLGTYFADERLCENGAFVFYRQEDVAAGMQYVPLLQNLQYIKAEDYDEEVAFIETLLRR